MSVGINNCYSVKSACGPDISNIQLILPANLKEDITAIRLNSTCNTKMEIMLQETISSNTKLKN